MFLLQKQRKGWFVRQQIGGSWIAQIILVVVNISVDYKSHKGQGKISPDQRRDLLSDNMFSGLFLSHPIWTFCSNSRSNLFKRFVRCVCIVSLIVFSVRTLMLAIFIHLYSFNPESGYKSDVPWLPSVFVFFWLYFLLACGDGSWILFRNLFRQFSLNLIS